MSRSRSELPAGRPGDACKYFTPRETESSRGIKEPLHANEMQVAPDTHAVFAAVARASGSTGPVALASGSSGPVNASAIGTAAAVIMKSKDAAPSTSGPEKPTRQKFDQAVLSRHISAAMPLRPMMASARHCTASGRNFTTAVVREASMFTISAHDANGKRRSEGGDEFVVTIRNGGVKVRSKVLDNKNGMYTV